MSNGGRTTLAVSSSRSEFGLIESVLRRIKEQKDLDFNIVLISPHS